MWPSAHRTQAWRKAKCPITGAGVAYAGVAAPGKTQREVAERLGGSANTVDNSRFGHYKMQFRELAKMKRNDSARQRSFYTKHLHFDKFVALSVVSVNELWGPVSEAFFKSIKLNGLKISKTPEKMPEP